MKPYPVSIARNPNPEHPQLLQKNHLKGPTDPEESVTQHDEVDRRGK